MKPERIQLSRKKGWRMPPNTVKVDRSTKWGNPFPVTETQDAKTVVAVYRKILSQPQSKTFDSCVHRDGLLDAAGGLRLLMWRGWVMKNIGELRGKNLACWCKIGEPCHADELLKLANK